MRVGSDSAVSSCTAHTQLVTTLLICLFLHNSQFAMRLRESTGCKRRCTLQHASSHACWLYRSHILV